MCSVSYLERALVLDILDDFLYECEEPFFYMEGFGFYDRKIGWGENLDEFAGGNTAREGITIRGDVFFKGFFVDKRCSSSPDNQ